MPDDLTALRDRLAGLCGWEATTKFGPTIWRHPDHLSLCEAEGEHPFPPDDLNALAAAWPANEPIIIEANWSGMEHRWCASAGMTGCEDCFAPTEYEARLRLTVAVLKAKEPVGPDTGEDGR